MKNTFGILQTFAVVIIMSFLIIGCGGGGSGQSPSGYSTPAPTTIPSSTQLPPENSYLEISPARILNPSSNEPVTLTYTFQTEIDHAEILFTDNRRVSLEQIDTYSWRLDLNPSEIFQYYSEGNSLVFIGHCVTYMNSNQYQRINLILPVRSNSMPDVDYTILSPDMQISDHVLNVRHDVLLLGGSTTFTVWNSIDYSVRTTIGSFDYFALVGQVDAFANRTGGSLLCFPNTTFFDLANKGAVHELGHCLGLAYSSHPLIAAYGHWKLGNAAYGIMGWANGGQGLDSTYWLEEGDLPGATKLRSMARATGFNDLEMYKIGLIPENEVGPILQFSDQETAIDWMTNRYTLPSCGTGCQVLNAASEHVTIEEIIAEDGATPPATDLDISIGTVVLSYGRLLNSDEMAFYDYMASRGEATEPVQAEEGLAYYESKPFKLATRGMMTLSTRIR